MEDKSRKNAYKKAVFPAFSIATEKLIAAI